jgi:hypothetical protein
MAEPIDPQRQPNDLLDKPEAFVLLLHGLWLGGGSAFAPPQPCLSAVTLYRALREYLNTTKA